MGTDERSPSHPQLPPGFRFHPTDEELLIHYLKKKVSSSPLPVSIIADVDLYKFDPWDLPGMARFGEQEWYFFSPRDRKYPNGARPNRAAASGYWKATGTDKPVVVSGTSHKVGVKKALVFYKGRPPKGIKTNWIMHEYRLTDSPCTPNTASATGRRTGSLRLDDWVLCRIYKKMVHFQRTEGSEGETEADDIPIIPGGVQYSQQQMPTKFEFESFSGQLQNEEHPSFLDMGFEQNTLDGYGSQPVQGVLFSSNLNSLKRSLSLVFNDDDIYNNSPKRPNVSSPFSETQSMNSLHKAAGQMGSYTDLQQVFSFPWSTETGHPWISYNS